MVVTEINPQQLALLFVTVIAPLLVGLLTKASWSQAVKSIMLAGISAVIGIVQGFLASPPGVEFSWPVAIVNGLIAWVIAVATYYGLWKPTGVAAKAQDVLVADKVGEHEFDATTAVSNESGNA